MGILILISLIISWVISGVSLITLVLTDEKRIYGISVKKWVVINFFTGLFLAMIALGVSLELRIRIQPEPIYIPVHEQLYKLKQP